MCVCMYVCIYINLDRLITEDWCVNELRIHSNDTLQILNSGFFLLLD